MKLKITIIILAIAIVTIFLNAKIYNENSFVTYKVDTKKQDLKLFWKNENGQNFGSIENLKLWIEKKNLKLNFAMNGGMYKKDYTPQELYIENQKTLIHLDTTKAVGNFYLKPNGVFYLTTDNTAKICTTDFFRNNGKIKFATQSGPMLLIDGKIHSDFKEGSSNLNIRNGVGILPDGKVVFVYLKKKLIFMISLIILKN